MSSGRWTGGGLAVTGNRQWTAMTGPLKLRLTDLATVDTSRAI